MTTLTPEQLAELKQLRERNPELRYEAHEKYRLVASLSGLTSEKVVEPLDKSALEFIHAHQGLFGLRDAYKELRNPVVSVDSAGWLHITYEQYLDDLPVWSGRLTVHIDPEKRLHSIGNSVRTNIPKKLQPTIDQNTAVKLARESNRHTQRDRVLREPRLFIYSDDPPALAWIFSLEGVQVSYEDKREEPGAWLYFVDAVRSKVLHRAALVKEAAQTSSGFEH